MNKILFIAWDAPHVSYLEGLFAPIFEGISKAANFKFDVLHFSWCSPERCEHLKSVCGSKGIKYTHVPVQTFPPIIGKYLTVLNGSKVIRKYVHENSIDIVMPRSTMPAKMVLEARLPADKVKIVFDADGLPIEERVDFAGLAVNSFRYKTLKKIESRMIARADRVITRSEAAIGVLLKTTEPSSTEKFRVVLNGRDEDLFRLSDPTEWLSVREQLNIPPDAFLMCYTGSLGPQYGVREMLYLLAQIRTKGVPAHLLVLSVNPEYLEQNSIAVPSEVVVLKTSFSNVPRYLAASDLGLAIRLPSFSMKGVAPVKLGEYLLCGLPVVASAGIGDTERILTRVPHSYILKDHNSESLDSAAEFVYEVWRNRPSPALIREGGIKFFGLTSSVRSYLDVLNELVS